MERVTASHLSHVQQVDLQEEAESTSCDLVGRSADGVAQLVADGQGAPLALRKDREERLINRNQNCPRSLQNRLVSGERKRDGVGLKAFYHHVANKLIHNRSASIQQPSTLSTAN